MNIAAAAEQDLTVPERIALVEDTWAMTRAGKEPVGVFLDVARELRSERNRLVVDFIAGHLDTVARSLVPEQKQKEFQAFVRRQFAPLAKEVGWSVGVNDSDEQKTLRASLLGILGSAGDPDAVAVAQKLTQAYMKDTNSVEGTIVGPALAVAAENSDAALYEQFNAAMGRTRSTEEYYHYLFALTSFRQPELARRTLALVDEGKIRQQDYVRLFPALLAESPAREIAWDYLKAHWETLAEKVTTFGGAALFLLWVASAPRRSGTRSRSFSPAIVRPGPNGPCNRAWSAPANCIEFKQLQGENMQKCFSRRHHSNCAITMVTRVRTWRNAYRV